MEWPLVIATFVLGIVLGYVGRTIVARNNESTSKEKVLEQTRLELGQHKQEVTDHFEGHYKQLAELTEQLNRVNRQWNEAANTLAPKSKTKALPTFSAKETVDTLSSQTDEQLDTDDVIIVNQNN